jgi:Tol biopolymer transport system component
MHHGSASSATRGALAGNLPATADVSAAAGGVLAFGGGATVDGPVWFDRTGKALGPVSGTGPLENLAFSPDHRQMVGNTPPPNEGIWLVDLDRGGATRMVADGVRPVWAPDGSRIAFSAWRAGKPRSIVSRVTTSAADELLLAEETTPAVVVNDWSHDGRFIAYVTLNVQTKNDVWLLPTFGDRKPVPLLATSANETQARISPNGHWIAYTSDESGTSEVYLQAFPDGGTKQTVSVGGGAQPQWRGDGKELYYLSLDNMLTAVEVTSDRTLSVGRPQPLFPCASARRADGLSERVRPHRGREAVSYQGGPAPAADFRHRPLARRGPVTPYQVTARRLACRPALGEMQRRG